MRSEKDSENAVERSLDDFIARANSTLPAIDEGTQPRAKLAEVKARRRAKPEPKASTLAVIGAEEQLAEVTEIVQRLPDAPEVPRRGPGWRLVLAFVAGAVAVLALTKLLTGGGRAQAPAAAPPAPTVVAAPVVTPVVTPVPVPKPVVEPIPQAELPPPAPAAVVEPAPAAPKPVVRAKPRPAVKPPAAAPAKEARGLVDPFAN
jgi:hypothetical protein